MKALKKFVFKIFDVSGGGRLSESDLFKVMKGTAPSITFKTSFNQM